MKEVILKFIFKERIWWILEKTLMPLSNAFIRLRAARKRYRIFADQIVLNGPFKGMKYPHIQATGSSIYPKLLGSYEYELNPIIELVLKKHYTGIVDIGCAEGYYAVGLGRLFPNASVFAFDTNDMAQRMCAKMAKSNSVDISIGGFCHQSTLIELQLGHKALIFSDCEGYENELFDDKIAQLFRSHDFLIEAHDLLREGTTERLLKIFQNTHNCKVIHTISDEMKAVTYTFTELEDFDLKERWDLLRENREDQMNWIFAEAES